MSTPHDTDLVGLLTSLTASKDLTEADTRAQFIDPVLSRLGWSQSAIKREPYAGWADSKGYIDYLLLIDNRPSFVVEAKRVGRSFSFPESLKKQRTTTYRKLMATAGPDLKEALEQCLRYAQHTGAPYACATTGLEWLFFKPTHQYRSLPDARVALFAGIDDILKNVDDFEAILSPSAIEQGRCEKALLGRDIQVPTFAKRLLDSFPYRRGSSFEEEEYSHILDQMLRHYVLDLTRDEDFRECYVPVKTNRGTAASLDVLISQHIQSLKATPTKNAAAFGSDLIDQQGLPNIVSGRTIILHGAIGVGKTSFLRHCEDTLRSGNKLDEAIWAKVDLLPFRDRPFEIAEVNSVLKMLCAEVQKRVSESTTTLPGRYDPDEWDHLRDIYNHEVRIFQKSRFPRSDDSDSDYITAAREYVWNLSREDPQEHLVRVIRWLTVNCHLPVAIVLDNSDQLGLEFQEFLYKLAETLQKSTCAIAILVLRTEALLSHRIREHVISSVVEQYQVQKAPLPLVLQKRFELMNRVISALVKEETSQHKVARERLSVLMDTLAYEAQQGSDTFRIVDAAGHGTLRDSLRAVAAIFRSSPRLMDRLVVMQSKNGNARLKAERALRALLKEDQFSSEASKLIPNVFMVEGGVIVPYSLGVRMLQQIKSKTALTDYSVSGLLNDFSIAGVDRAIAARVLSRLRTENFVVVPHILEDLRDVDPLRLSPLGNVLLEVILGLHDYYDQIVFETFIYAPDVYRDMKAAWNSGAEPRDRFKALGRLFAGAIIADDEVLRHRLSLSLLEPPIGEPIPGTLSVAQGS